MKIVKNIRRFIFLALWLVLGSCVLVLLIASINIKKQKSCRAVEIEIEGVEEYYFLDKNEILKIISDDNSYSLVGKEIEGFDLQRLEKLLRKNVWVQHAELFFDNNLVLHVKVREREPVARIFTKIGHSFYIDSSGYKMPLHNKLSARLPVFTGFPANQPELHGADSLLMDHIKKISLYILNDSFWMAQVAQVDITQSRTFELYPTIGNHVIEFGSGENYSQKFRNLFVFYRQVLTHTGLDKYSRLNVQYENQVIGTRKGEVARYDSIQALKNIQKMIQEATRIAEDTLYAPVVTVEPVAEKKPVVTPLAGLVKKPVVTAVAPVMKKPVVIAKTVKKAPANVNKQTKATVVRKPAAPVKNTVQPKAAVKKNQKKESTIKKHQPKAVMPKKNETKKRK
jgi:cell division protein FtsQ